MYEGKVFEAIQLASHKHKNQKKKVFEYPYITHPLMVFHTVSHFTDDEDILCAAVLHDTVEDTDTSLEEIHTRFGNRVSDYVDNLSEDKSLPHHERKEQYRQKFISTSPAVCLIKSADIFCNLKDSIEVYTKNPESEFAFRTSNVSWAQEKRAMIETISIAWPENPLSEKLLELVTKFENLIKRTN